MNTVSIIIAIVASGFSMAGILIVLNNHTNKLMEKSIEAGIAKAQLDVYLHYDNKKGDK